MKIYAMFSSHCDGRKTHIADGFLDSFCGVEKRNQHLLFDIGDEIKNGDVDSWSGHNSQGNLCLVCEKKSKRVTAPASEKKGGE